MAPPHTGYPYLDEPRERGAVLALAHRGGAGSPELAGLENTLKAFTAAVALGYRYLETDVHATSDGQLLAFHDTWLDRVTDVAGRIWEQPYADLAAARIGGSEPIPRLADLLEEFPGARFNVDLKSPSAAEPMVELLVRRGAQDRVCVGSFAEPVLRRFRALVRTQSDRAVATACGVATVLATLSRSPHRPTTRLLRDPGAAFQVPVRHRGLRVVDQRFVTRAHGQGRQVHVWTVNEPAEMEGLLDLGVDGLITDRTDLLKQVLVRRGQWDGQWSGQWDLDDDR